MPAGYAVNGTDFDSIFAAYESGTKKAATGYKVEGVDLSDRYAPIEQGAAAAATGYKVAGADLNTLFAAVGTLSQPIAGLNGKALSASDDSVGGSSVYANVTVTLKSDGNWSVAGDTSDVGTIAQPAPTSGTWLTSGVPGDYEVQYDFTITNSDAALTVTNGAAAWAPLSVNRSAGLELRGFYSDTGSPRAGAASVRIRIRRTATGSVVSDNTVTMAVDVASMA